VWIDFAHASQHAIRRTAKHQRKRADLWPTEYTTPIGADLRALADVLRLVAPDSRVNRRTQRIYVVHYLDPQGWALTQLGFQKG
jgi:hypothetical protein